MAQGDGNMPGPIFLGTLQSSSRRGEFSTTSKEPPHDLAEEQASDIPLRNATAPLAVSQQTQSPGSDDHAVVAPAQVLATGANPVAGVMSPSEDAWLDWKKVRVPCARCGHSLADPAICAYCGIYGHSR